MTETMLARVESPIRPDLEPLVQALTAVVREHTDPAMLANVAADVLDRLRPRVDRLLTEDERAGTPDKHAGYILHAEPDFSVYAVVWRPGQGTQIHDHIVWCSFLGLQGTETETLYLCRDDELVDLGVRERPVGSVSAAAPPDDIHRVTNNGTENAITLHVYGADLREVGSSVRRYYPDPVR